MAIKNISVNLVANSRLGIVNYNPRKIRRESGATRSLRTLWVPEEDTRILLASSRGHHTGGPKSTRASNVSEGPTLNSPHAIKNHVQNTHTHTSVQEDRKHCSRLLKWISIRIRVPNELSQRLLKRNAHAGQSLANEFSLSAASASLDNMHMQAIHLQ